MEWDEIYSSHSDLIYRLCKRMVGENDAEDLFQEIFLDIYNSLDSFRGEAAVSTWIYRIAVNHCAKHTRRKKLISFIPLVNDIMEESDSPSAELEKSETENMLNTAINQLPGRQKTAVVLYYFHQMKHKEIAEILSISPKAVESTMARAKQTMARILTKTTRIY